MARTLPLAAALAAIGLTGCGSAAAPPAAAGAGSAPSVVTAGASLGAADTKINATDNLTFAPATTTVKVGQIVEWDDPGTEAHNISFDSQSAANDGDFGVGAKWQVKFNAAGTYTYQCTFHPGMTGTVTVTP